MSKILTQSKKHLADAHEAEQGQVEDKPITVDTIKLGAEKTYHPKTREIIRQQE